MKNDKREKLQSKLQSINDKLAKLLEVKENIEKRLAKGDRG